MVDPTRFDGPELLAATPTPPTSAELDRLGALARAVIGDAQAERQWLRTGEVPATITSGVSIVLGRQRRAYNSELLAWFRYDPAALEAEKRWVSYWRERAWVSSRGDDTEPVVNVDDPREGGVWVEASWSEVRLHVLAQTGQGALL